MAKKKDLNLFYKQKINQLVEVLKQVKPEKIILFGSVAHGKIRPGSDIDICLIKKTRDPWKVKSIVSDLMWKYDVGFDPELDLRVYPPSVYYDWLKRNDPFIEEIDKGKVVYER